MEKKLKSLAFHTLVPIMLSFIIWMLIPDYTAFYEGLRKPVLRLPQGAFVFIWCFIYLLMGIAAHLVEMTKTDDIEKQKAFSLYYLQLLVNLLWMPMFFGFKNLFVAALWTVLLLIMVILNLRKFTMIKRSAGYLFVVYLLWVLFLTYYVIAIDVMN
ncbi:MAG: tryptophan-rich sensory protein [Firmicutes bacterium]|nr:tryptophan-rich sensory protein [Bacillota bacterium]